MGTATGLWRVREHLSPRQRQQVRRWTDSVTSPIGSLRGVRTADPTVGLTFDDGPDETATPRVLEVLDEFGAKATFFVLADAVVQNRQLTQEVRARGHEVGLHGRDHRRLTQVPRRNIRPLLHQAREAVEQVTGQPVRWFRPAYGAQSPATYLAARRAGLDVAVWSAEGEDWRSQPVEQMVARAADATQPGAILLLHDGLDGADETASTPQERVDALSQLLEQLCTSGHSFVTVSQLLSYGRPWRTAWFRP